MSAMTLFRDPLLRPFLFFAALALLLLVAFAGWSAAIFMGPAVPAFDREVAEAFAAQAPARLGLNGLMALITKCGGVTANFLIALGGALWMWVHHRRRFAFAWLIIACIGGLIDLGLKEAFGRERPPVAIRDEAAAHLTNESYPSGHSMGSVIGYGMLGFVLIQRVKNRPGRIALAAALAAWVVLIGVSRLYLRAHWTSDVIGGWLLGLGYMNACLAIYFWRSPSAASNRELLPNL
jgi:membrane-associated phospholipid phosphatase